MKTKSNSSLCAFLAMKWLLARQCVILSAAVFQAERRISRVAQLRFLLFSQF